MQFAADVQHEYVDKYLLAEFVTSSAISAFVNTLDTLGINEKQLEQMKDWAKNRSVTLRLKVRMCVS
jgi:hypothetical protein